MNHIIITKYQVNNYDDPELIVIEQQEKMNILGIDDSIYLCHFFDSEYTSEKLRECSINDAIQYLAIKEGYDLVQFSNGNYGFVAYYNGTENGFEIIGREV